MLVCISSSLVVQAQHEQSGENQFELNIVWGYAQNSFEDNLDRPMPGLIFSFGGRTPNLPLYLGTEIGWMSYGFDNYLDLQFPSSTNNAVPATLVNVATKNSILLTHLVARVVPLETILAPYIEGLLGFKYITTGIDVESEVLFDDDGEIIINGEDRIMTSSTHYSFPVSYGFGAGFNIQIYEGQLGYNSANTTISIHAGVQYLFGSKADYLTENSIQPEENRIRFEQVESNTDMLIPKVAFRVGMK